MTTLWTDDFAGYADGTLLDATKYDAIYYPATWTDQLKYAGGTLVLDRGTSTPQAVAFPKAAGVVAATDVDLTFDVTTTTLSTTTTSVTDEVGVFLRSDKTFYSASTNNLMPSNGLSVRWMMVGNPTLSTSRRRLDIRACTGGTSSATIALVAPAGLPQAVPGGTYGFRVRLEGRRIQVKIWDKAAGGQPDAWLVDVTAADTVTSFPTVAGGHGIGADILATSEYRFDNLVIDDLAVTVPRHTGKAWTGTGWVPAQQWDGTGWAPVIGAAKRWDGTGWVPA